MTPGQQLRIVYMGTPDFAVAPLQRLHESDYNIVAVVTMPDKPAGRGLKLKCSPVKDYATANGLTVLQPERLKDDAFIATLRELNPDLGIVVAFRMLPQAVWSLPRMGTFNLHASLLPQYRGAAPINRAIMNGDTQTGVTTFLLDKQIDTGDMLLNQTVAITDTDTAGTLHDKLMEVGKELVVESVERIATGDLRAIPQSEETTLLPAPKIFREDCRIDWNHSLETIYNQIRGLSPYPAAWCEIAGAEYKIFSATKLPGASPANGTVSTDGKTYLKVACEGGFINILELQLAGKKRMDIVSFLRGNKID